MTSGKRVFLFHKLLLPDPACSASTENTDLGLRVSSLLSGTQKHCIRTLGLEIHLAKVLFSTDKSRTVCVNVLRKNIYFPSFSALKTARRCFSHRDNILFYSL